jgi:protein-S-isoprenylcysteine O-methyltransferase Ste14
MADSLQNPPIFKHARDITILPVTVTILIPFLIYKEADMVFIDNYISGYIGSLFIFFGLLLFLYTVILLAKIGKGTLAPWTPTQRLVVAGPYKYCRNPMISGILFILIGQALLLASFNVTLWTALFFTLNTLYFVSKEEPDLLKRFGDDYVRYSENVPRWIPRVNPYELHEVVKEST